MKTTFTFDRLEIEELIREKLCAPPPHGKVNINTEFMNFKFLAGNPAREDAIVTVEVEKKISIFER